MNDGEDPPRSSSAPMGRQRRGSRTARRGAVRVPEPDGIGAAARLAGSRRRERPEADHRGRPGRDQRVLRDRRVRARALPPRAAGSHARRRAAGGGARARAAGEHQRVHLRGADRRDDDLDRDRRARRARAGLDPQRRPGRPAQPRRRGRDRGRAGLPADRLGAAGGGRDGAEVLCDRARRGRGPARRAPAARLQPRSSTR